MYRLQYYKAKDYVGTIEKEKNKKKRERKKKNKK